jgi:hypothetical protein
MVFRKALDIILVLVNGPKLISRKTCNFVVQYWVLNIYIYIYIILVQYCLRRRRHRIGK